MEPSVGVYVHIPFCERVCPYCDFAVVATRDLTPDLETRYVDALLLELERRQEAFAGRRLASLYFGGGTPSLCRPASLERIVRAVAGAFAIGNTPETTLEINPGRVERARLPGFREVGVNRISVGVQSFDDGVLKRLGRAHRAEEVHRTLRACREAAFAAVSLDLIFAAPGQTPAAVECDLAQALTFAPEHLSSYELSIEPGTPFATAARRGQLRLPGEEEVLAIYELLETRLGAAGFDRYELSNYARPGFEAVHNQRYWQRLPVLGLGVGAFSTDPAGSETPFGLRRWNERDLGGYLARVEAGGGPAPGASEVLDAATARGEAVFLALRTRRGVDAEAFAAEFGGPPRRFFGAAIEGLVAQALLEEAADGGLLLTARGRLLSDNVFAHFV